MLALINIRTKPSKCSQVLTLYLLSNYGEEKGKDSRAKKRAIHCPPTLFMAGACLPICCISNKTQSA